MKQWFYAQRGEQNGPIPEQQLAGMFKAGQLTADTLVWTHGFSQWRRAGEVEGLIPVELLPPPLPTSAPAPPPAIPIAPPSSVPELPVQTEQLRPTAPVYAGFWRRFAAVFIDGVVLLVPSWIINLLLAPVTGPITTQLSAWFLSLSTDSKQPFPMGAAILYQMITLLTSGVFCIYFAAMQGRPRAATLGKMAVGSVVLREDGRHLTFWGAFLRELVKNTLWSFTLGLAMLPAAFTRRKQALHDLIFSTVVVQRKS